MKAAAVALIQYGGNGSPPSTGKYGAYVNVNFVRVVQYIGQYVFKAQNEM